MKHRIHAVTEIRAAARGHWSYMAERLDDWDSDYAGLFPVSDDHYKLSLEELEENYEQIYTLRARLLRCFLETLAERLDWQEEERQ